MSETEENRLCLACGNKLMGRVDKKFCDDQCRSAWHNRMSGDESRIMRNINYLLRKNRRILFQFCPAGKGKASRAELLKAGFNFDYITSIYRTRQGKTYFYCYDLGYLELEDGSYAIVVKQDYVN